MEEQKKVLGKGGTMRLGSYDCQLVKNSLAQRVYNKTLIKERHRHRFEFNNQFKSLFEKQGVVFSGLNGEKNLVEILEIPNHPFFLGVQFHPEFQSKPLCPHPLFTHFIQSSLEQKSSTSPDDVKIKTSPPPSRTAHLKTEKRKSKPTHESPRNSNLFDISTRP